MAAAGRAREGGRGAGGRSRGAADSGDRRRRGGVGRGSVAEFAGAVVPPAADGAVLKQGAAIKGAEVDGSDRADSRRSEPLGLADRDGWIGRSDGDGLRADLSVGQSTGEHNDSYSNAEI